MEQTKTISLFSSEELSKSKDKREEFFAQVFNLYYKRIFNYTYYRINVKDDAEDLTSQIFQKVISKINTFNKDKAEFEIWLFVIARNTVNDYLRKSKIRKIVSLDNIFNMADKKKGPEEQAINKDIKAKLIESLKILDKDERNIIAYKFGAELRNTEIARILNMSESNVGVKLHRIMKKLKKKQIKEKKNMRKSNIQIAIIVAASFLIMSTAVIYPIFAKDQTREIRRYINIGGVPYVQEGDYAGNKYLDRDILGLIIDFRGTPLTTYKDIEKVFEREEVLWVQGTAIDSFDDDGVIITTKQKENNSIKKVTDKNEIDEHLAFKAAFPEYLPEGYEFEEAIFYKDKDGSIDNADFVILMFKNTDNDNVLRLFERDSKSGFIAKGKSRKTKVNGKKAETLNSSAVQWSIGDITYSINGTRIGLDDLRQIAESIK